MRIVLVLIAMVVVFACVCMVMLSDGDNVGDVLYEGIQDGQNTIKGVGQTVKDSDLNADAPTLQEVWDAIP